MATTEHNALLGTDSRLILPGKIINPNERERVTIGQDCLIQGELKLWDGDGLIEIGDCSFVGEGTRIWSANSIKIGNHVQIAHNCNLFDNNVHSMNWEERRVEFAHNVSGHIRKLHEVKARPMRIEDDVWICAGVHVVRGITIGKGSVIGAGSVVMDSIPEFSLAVGNPATVVRSLK